MFGMYTRFSEFIRLPGAEHPSNLMVGAGGPNSVGSWRGGTSSVPEIILIITEIPDHLANTRPNFADI